jgi:hypothetical protein
VVLLTLSQQDPTAAIQCDTVITGKQSCLCLHHIPDIEGTEECMYRILRKNQENWDQTCDKTASQGKTMSHTQVLSGFITLKMSTHL